jgi:ABC-type multidrug transport system fused ATPase/permease subunit
VASGLNVLLSRAVLQVFKGVAGLLAAIAYDWRVTLGTLAVAPLLVLVIRRLGRRIKRYSGRALESQAGLYASAGEALRGLRVVKVNQAEPRESGRFRRLNERMLHELNRVRTARALASPLTEMLTIFLLCGIVLGAGNAILKQNVDPTDFIMVIGCLAVAGASLKPLTGIVNDVQIASPAAERLREVLRTTPEPGHERRLPRLARHARDLRFEGITLTYPGAVTPALRDVSLTLRHGERVAFVGPNGSGKSTLLGLVPRLYDPDAGRVLVDGVDIRGVRVGSLRRQIAVVTQETVLFRGSVAENIGYGALGATRAQVERAARLARADEFIRALPGGYDAELAEQGATLSGGQRQRLAIARAVLRDPAILILDEATSMIDADSEAQIGAALAEFGAGRTCLIVAHRLSTVVGCDSIVVLDAGRVVDQGTHAELLTRCEVYRQLARHQFAGVG